MPILKQHYGALIVACIVGTICMAPYMYFAFTPQYQGVALMGQDAEEHYLARIQEVYNGHPLIGNTYLPYKDTPYLFPPLGEDAVAAVGKILHLSPTQINIASKFFFPAIVFLLIYALAYHIVRSRAPALAGAACAMFTEQILSNPTSLLSLLHGEILADGSYWARPINPELSGIFLFGSLLLLWLAYFAPNTGKPKIWMALGLGAWAGGSLYISPYPWSFLGATLLLLCVYFLYTKNFAKAAHVAIAGAVALVCSAPFAINYISAHAEPGYSTAALQQGVLSSHTPVVGLWIGVLLLVPLFLWPKGLKAARSFFLISAVALLIVLNQQIITGFYLQPGHFHWYITKPILGLMLALWAYTLASHIIYLRRFLYAGSIALVVFLLMYAGLAQTHFYQVHSPASVAAQSYAPILAYINTLPEPQTILANSELSDYISIYTSANAPGDTYAPFYIAPPHYFEALSSLKASLTSTSQDPVLALSARALGITLFIVDTSTDQWAIASGSGFMQKQLIGGRFAVYESTSGVR